MTGGSNCIHIKNLFHIYIQSKKLRETLNELYIHLDSAAALGGSEDLPTGLAGFGQGEYYPYVYYKINIDMVGPSSSNIWTSLFSKYLVNRILIFVIIWVIFMHFPGYFDCLKE